MRVILDDARPGHERLQVFSQPHSIICAHTIAEVPAALLTLEEAISSGAYVAGYFSYELGYALEKKLQAMLPAQLDAPLLQFGVFDAPQIIEAEGIEEFLAQDIKGRAYAGPLRHEWDRSAYTEHFQTLHKLIAAGDIYQANLSFRSSFAFLGDAMALYAKIRAHAGSAYCAFIDDGARQILSFSPELFFEISCDGILTAKPMKGTAPRGQDMASDETARQALERSEKDRAENLMIVDLMRNDLGHIAQTGSVKVEDLFAIETFPTVHQMVSTVRAQLQGYTSISRILNAVFPCGSITGAPKIRAMQILREAEDSARGLYCGALGLFAPGGSAKFNVAIRTLTLSSNQGQLGIGGGVVFDSSADDEYDECLLKARYFETAREPLSLIETLRYDPQNGFTRLELHLQRMASSASTFGIGFDRNRAIKTLQDTVLHIQQTQRVRLTLDESGVFACTSAALEAPAKAWSYAVSRHCVQSEDQLLQHKTSWRSLYDSEHATLSKQTGCAEVLFLNERFEIAEGSRSNIFVQIQGKLVTPPLECGILNGCLRRELIETGEAVEHILTLKDIEQADAVYFGNSLRGMIKAEPILSCVLKSA